MTVACRGSKHGFAHIRREGPVGGDGQEPHHRFAGQVFLQTACEQKQTLHLPAESSRGVGLAPREAKPLANVLQRTVGIRFPSGNAGFWCFISPRQQQENNRLLEH